MKEETMENILIKKLLYLFNLLKKVHDYLEDETFTSADYKVLKIKMGGFCKILVKTSGLMIKYDMSEDPSCLNLLNDTIKSVKTIFDFSENKGVIFKWKVYVLSQKN